MMQDEMPALDPRLGDYLAAELQRAERDFPAAFARKPAGSPARSVRSGWLVAAVIGVLVMGIAAGSWSAFSQGLGAGGSGWAGVEAIGLRGMPMSLAIADPDGVIAGRRPATIDELRAHRNDIEAIRMALTPLAGGEWLLSWASTPCDVSGMLTVSKQTLTLAMNARPPCELGTTVHAAVLRFAPSVAPAGLALTLVDPPDPIPEADAIAIAKQAAGVSDVISGGIDAVLGTYATLVSIEPNGIRSGAASPAPQINPDLFVWRVDIFGNTAWARVFVDAFTRQVVDVAHHDAFRFDVSNRSSVSVEVSVGSDMGGWPHGFEPGQSGTGSILMNNPANGVAVEVLSFPSCATVATGHYPTTRPFTLVIEDGATPGSVKLSTVSTVAASPMPLPANMLSCGGG